MNEEKLTKESDMYVYNNSIRSRKDYKECFKAGARWHESLPLSEKLSTAEIGKIKKIYNDFKNFETQGVSILDRKAAYCQCVVLEGIFGKDLFTKANDYEN